MHFLKFPDAALTVLLVQIWARQEKKVKTGDVLFSSWSRSHCADYNPATDDVCFDHSSCTWAGASPVKLPKSISAMKLSNKYWIAFASL